MFSLKNKFRTVAMGIALCAVFGCNDEKAGEVKALGNQMASAEKIDEKKAESLVNPQEQPAKTPEAKQKDADKSLIRGKVRKVVGECDMLKPNADWNRMRIGQRVVENDRIRTALESEALVGVNDGSTLLISELSDVTISAEMLDSMSRRISVWVNKGNVYFDVQKQGESQMDFRTGVAVAAIRGTAGFVGNIDGGMVASLREGRVEVSSGKNKTEIVKNQTVVVTGKGKSKKLKLKSSGTKALAMAIDSLSKTSDGSIEKLTKALEKFDNVYAVRQATFAKKLESNKIKFEAWKLPETTELDSVVLIAQATPGLVVSVMGEVDTIPATGLYQRTFKWDEGTYGVKRFIAGCREGDLEIPCGLWSTIYVKPAASDEESAAKVEKDLRKLTVSIEGKRDERIHRHKTEGPYTGNLKFSLKGIGVENLDELKSIQVRKGKTVVETIGANDLTSLSYEVPVSVGLNHVAEYEVVVSTKNGKNFRGKKTYEVFCLESNHPGGKARNRVLDENQEYEKVKSQLVRD